ncbi:MAG: UDP-2,3-diacylglucosamine diphosphatase LpxI [Candidatus Aureabacteria bacterium]|nr:UDP-2,3-diacylglucosamine diphosphatase LpxI [Candidatus Auribacterota bacterium]
MMDNLGIIAGNGDYPILVAKGARRSGVKRIITAALVGETEKGIESFSDVVCWIEIGQLGKLISFFRKNNVSQVIMAGQVTPTRLFGRLKLDLRMVKLLARIKMKGAEPIFSTVADELSRDGIELIDSSVFMKDQLAEKGWMTGKKPDAKYLADIRFGLKIARGIADLDIGQTIVVKDKAVVAVEAIEGTDATIRRAASLAGPEAVIVKVCKKKQDMRFDLPVVGSRTLDVMKESRARILAVESGRSLILDKDQFLKKAREAGVHVYGISEEDA